ncbi:23995_t:CDS:1 [Dentiscutata erythropus]|uniref:23995_t:CDS:1 n=1 Tax=Dentiscutata erythropus TaxID=1348616 RepID=A0A9N9D5G3_9GLOM|nr:23995_t:CDS:1 [Dentiscutata erythropus]
MPKWAFVHENGRSPSSHTRRTMPEEWRSIRVPFPPKINAHDFVKPRRDGSPKKRCANYFLVYRVQFAEALKAHCCNSALMTDISSMAGDAWREEPEHVRRFYKQIANDIKRLHSESVKSAQNAKSSKTNTSSKTIESSVKIQPPSDQPPSDQLPSGQPPSFESSTNSQIMSSFDNIQSPVDLFYEQIADFGQTIPNNSFSYLQNLHTIDHINVNPVPYTYSQPSIPQEYDYLNSGSFHENSIDSIKSSCDFLFDL